ncbi:MAG: adenylate/guanylate cyclase domain-containing protein [Gammaproteobacteria bacterium]|nr:adenylate/guanylate cyclase domain-containing protein [Gammaproteobacteria bacterium]
MLKTSCAIMFADISGSTQMYDQLGNEAAKQTIDKCLGQLQVVTEAHKGIVIKKIGDELMCRFDSADAAVSAARVSQMEIRTLATLENSPLSIRAGIHYGDVIEDDDDIFGDAVNIAARMAGIAKGGQIITTEDTVSELGPELSSQTRQVDLTRVKGKQEKLAVFEVLWEQSGDVTRVATELLSRSIARPSKLRLSRGDEVLEISSESDSIWIGRDESCDLIVNTALASRKHAYCELRRGKFVLVDQGTNGTYVSSSGEDEVYLRREDTVLRGSGSISLGKPVADTAAEELIYFEC